MRLGRTVPLLAALAVALAFGGPVTATPDPTDHLHQLLQPLPTAPALPTDGATNAAGQQREEVERAAQDAVEGSDDAPAETGEAEERAEETAENAPARPNPPNPPSIPDEPAPEVPAAPEAPALPSGVDEPPTPSLPDPLRSYDASTCYEDDEAGRPLATHSRLPSVIPEGPASGGLARLGESSVLRDCPEVVSYAPQPSSQLAQSFDPPAPRVIRDAFWEEAAALAAAVVLIRALWSHFSRLEPDEVLNHPRRAQILQVVREQPGVESNTVAKALGIGWGLFAYHLDHLVRAGHVKIHRVGGRTALFIPNVGHRGREEGLALLRRPTHRRVHERLLVTSGGGQAELAEVLGLTRARISQILSQLSVAGLVEVREGAGRRLYEARPVH